MSKAVAVVPAGGLGSRLGVRQPKQYLAVGGAPIVVLTLRALARCRALDGLIVVAPADRLAATRDLLRRFRVPRVIDVVPGGAERQDSVRAGLESLEKLEPKSVLIHDAARPLVDAAGEVCGVKYNPADDNGRRLRRIADHVRATWSAEHSERILFLTANQAANQVASGFYCVGPTLRMGRLGHEPMRI